MKIFEHKAQHGSIEIYLPPDERNHAIVSIEHGPNGNDEFVEFTIDRWALRDALDRSEVEFPVDISVDSST